MNILPITKESKRRQRWADKQKRKQGKTPVGDFKKKVSGCLELRQNS